MIPIVVVGLNRLNPIDWIFLIRAEIIQGHSFLVESCLKIDFNVQFRWAGLRLSRGSIRLLLLLLLFAPVFVNDSPKGSFDTGDNLVGDVRIVWVSVLYCDVGVEAMNVETDFAAVIVDAEDPNDGDFAD